MEDEHDGWKRMDGKEEKKQVCGLSVILGGQVRRGSRAAPKLL